MKCPIREKRYYCGNYLEVDLFTVYAPKKGSVRRSRPAPDIQERHNKRRAERALIRLINTNFSDGDLKIELTYDPDNYPDGNTYEAALKVLQNFIRRLKRIYKKLGIDFKYIANVERGKRSGRLHHHLIIPKGISLDVINDCWKRGIIRSTPLRMGPQGAAGLAKYFAKDPEGFKRWHASKGLKKPEVEVSTEGKVVPDTLSQIEAITAGSGCVLKSRSILPPTEKTRTGFISQKQVKEWAELGFDARASIEKLYPGFVLSEVNPYYNDINKSWYVTILMYRNDGKGGKYDNKKAKARAPEKRDRGKGKDHKRNAPKKG